MQYIRISTNSMILNGSATMTGDIIIIPAGVPHGWLDIADHVDYLSVRPDPDRVLPANYVNPSLKR